MKALVTGANGFIGKALTPVLANNGWSVTALVRKADPNLNCARVEIGDVLDPCAIERAVKEQEVVVHLANRAHVFEKDQEGSGSVYCRVNTEGTLALAKAALAAGVKRFIYISSIKVNGEHTQDRAFSHEDKPQPQDAYAKSKWQAEQGLWSLCQESGIELVVLRPPLVYGAGVKGNLAKLMQAVTRGWPLPFKGVGNRRDLIALENLVDLICHCMVHPAAAGHTFLCCDGAPVSTEQIVEAMAQAAGKKAHLFYLPPGMLKLGAQLLGKNALYDRLFQDLRIDMAHTCSILHWVPPVTAVEAMGRAFETQIQEQSACA